MENNNKELGFAGKIAKVFVMNSRLSLLLILTLFAWGILSFFLTPKQYNPEITAPAFQVITEFPGASSKEVEELITKPLENEIMDIDGVDEVLSQSREGGVSMITVKFFVGESVEESKIKINQKIFGNLDLSPTGAMEPIIKDMDPDDVPVMTLAIQSQDLSPVVLRKISLDIKDELNNVNDVSNIEVIGGRKRELKISLDTERMIAQETSVLQIFNILKTNNLKFIEGNLDTGTKKTVVEIDSNIESIADLENLVISTTGEQIVYLKDVADISEGTEEIESYVKYKKANEENENEVVFISLAKKKGSNISKVTNDILSKIEELKETVIPSNITIDVVNNEGKTASDEIFGLVVNLIQSIVIVAVILFLFLGSRAAVIVAVAIPLTLASVFGIGLLGGHTINRITLFALILSLGLLVDNATVVVENAVRYVKTGLGKKEAVIEAVDEVGMGLLMSTITTLFAFFPMAFVTGMMGPYMGPIPFFVPVALIVSLIIAFTINPFLSSVFLQKENEKPVQKESKFSQIKEKVEGKFTKLMENYEALLHKIFRDRKLRKKILTITTVAFILSMLLPAVGIVKFRMLPKADKEQFYVYLDLPQGTLSEETNRISNEVESFLLDQKDVISIQSFVGKAPVLDFSGLFKGASGRLESHQSSIKVNLTHHKDRSRTSEEIVQEIRPLLYDFLQNEPDAKIKFIEDPPGPPVMSTMMLMIKGNDLNTLKEISYDLEQMLNTTKEVVDIDTTRTEDVLKLSLKVDLIKALKSGISAEQAASTLNIYLKGIKASVLHDDQNKEQEYIFLRLNKEDRNQLEDLNSIFISNNKGEKIPLSEIVTLETTSAEDILYRDNREQTVYVYAEMGNRSVTYATIDLFKKLKEYKLPSENGKTVGISFFGVDIKDQSNNQNYNLEWGGEWKLTVEVFRDLGTAMGVAIFLVYVVLVAQFHSFKTPILIMATIPLAMIGVLPGFAVLGWLIGIYFNATSMIGVIALSGIVVNNAIILVEYLNGLREKGLSAEEAIVEAGSTRFRPIVLTSLTTILGSLTIISDPVWSGLAWSIVFGISISTALTLIIFPVLYYTFEGKDWNCQKDDSCENHGPSLN